MNNIAIDHNQPHHVLLVFQGTTNILNNESILRERSGYYQELKQQGKVILGGNFWNLDRTFVIIQVDHAAELEEIIDNDPALSSNVFELVRVMAFTPEHDSTAFTIADQYQLDRFA